MSGVIKYRIIFLPITRKQYLFKLKINTYWQIEVERDMKLLKKKLLIYMVLCFVFLQVISTSASAQFESICLGTSCLLFAVIWFVIAILIAIWVYKDAEKRGSSGALWLIIVILLPKLPEN